MVPEEVFIVGLCGLPPAFGHRAPDEFMRGKKYRNVLRGNGLAIVGVVWLPFLQRSICPHNGWYQGGTLGSTLVAAG